MGTKNILSLAKDIGVKYFIYTSSPSVVFSGKPISEGNEKLSYVSNRVSPYSHTKALAEEAVLHANNNPFLSTSLRPHLIWGENDPHLLPKVISRHKNRKLKIVGEGNNQVDLTHIDNVVHAHILAFNALLEGYPLGGKAYFISQNEPVKLWDWLNSIFRDLNLDPIYNKISFPKAYCAGAFLEILWKILRLKNDLPMSRFVACQLAHDHWFSTEAAKSDFGYEPIISMSEAMKKHYLGLETCNYSFLRLISIKTPVVAQFRFNEFALPVIGILIIESQCFSQNSPKPALSLPITKATFDWNCFS